MVIKVGAGAEGTTVVAVVVAVLNEYIVPFRVPSKSLVLSG